MEMLDNSNISTRFDRKGSFKSSTTSEPGYPRKCDYCQLGVEFLTSYEFARHIRLVHTTQEGGSFSCMYGENGVCQKLPLEGVCDVDFEAHIRRCHTNYEDFARTNDDGLSLRSVRLTSETPTDLSERTKFNLSSFTQNLSAVLSDPGRSRNETATFFTRHWGDSFIPQTSVAASKKLAKVSEKTFDNYNKTTGESYKRYRSIRRELHLSHGDNGSRSDEKQDADDLPTIFIDPRFALSDADTFTAVFTVPASDDVDALRQTLSGRNAVPATPIEVARDVKSGEFRDYDSLQSRLEMMHDVVDGRLAAKLVSKTDAFWQVVRSYSGLQEQLASAMKSVKDVRQNLRQVDELVCEQSSKIVEIHTKSESKKKLLAKLHDIACLREAQSTVQMMLSQGDYPKAIECIETSLDVLSGDLAGVTCFRHLASQLHELYDVIGRMMGEDFATTIQRELGVKPEAGTLIQAEGELSAVLLGLMRMRKYAFVGVLRVEIAEGIKNVMRQVVKAQILNSGVDLSGFDPSLMQLAEPVRRMSHNVFVEAVKATMDELYEFCKRLEAIQELMLDIADRALPSSLSKDEADVKMTPNQSVIVEDEEDMVEEEDDEVDFDASVEKSANATATTLLAIEIRSEELLRKVLPIIAEYGHQCAQQRIARLLYARGKIAAITESMAPGQLAELLELVNDYQERCRRWYLTQTQKSGPLGRAVKRLSMDYIEKFHAAKKIRIGNILDTELWKASSVPERYQAMIDKAVETGKLRNLRDTESKMSISTSHGENVADVGLESFTIVGSSLTMIEILADYCEAIEVMPEFVQDWNSRVIELLKTYNSRSCQLILGAGALQLVGLKTISAKNLALAARSLEFIIKFISMIRDEADRVLGDDRKNLLRHYKQVESEYREHVNEITQKLIAVVEIYLSNCLLAWEVTEHVPSKPFQQIATHMQKFHKGLSGIMTRQQIAALFAHVDANFKRNLKQRLEELAVTPHDSLKFGYATKDYMYYQQNLVQMESCKDMKLQSLNEYLFAG